MKQYLMDKDTVVDAFNHPRKIDEDLVHSRQKNIRHKDIGQIK